MKNKQRWKYLFILMTFVIGSVSYYVAGEDLSTSLYAAFTLYFVSPTSGAYNAGIEIARWMAAIVMTAAILHIIEGMWQSLRDYLSCVKSNIFKKGSIAVYCDTDIDYTFETGEKKLAVIYPGREYKNYVDTHIIMLDSDAENFEFYKKYKQQMKGTVYICIRETEYALIQKNTEIRYFDIYGSIARQLWKENIRLWERQGDKSYTITIYGENNLTSSVIYHALLLNLFALDQQISYHVIGGTTFEMRHGGVETCNRDTVEYHPDTEDVLRELLPQSDYVIVTEKLTIEKLQTFGVLCKNTVYYYAPEADITRTYLNMPNLKAFGQNTEIFTDKNVRQENLILAAKELNKNYDKNSAKSADELWTELDGFLRASNISAADYNAVMRDLLRSVTNATLEEQSARREELAELEHIRWWRFYLLNYWKYGEKKNIDKKIHTCLRPYEELSEDDKDKDRATVTMVWNGLFDEEKE